MYVAGSNRNTLIEYEVAQEEEEIYDSKGGVRGLFSKRALSELNFQELIETDHQIRGRSAEQSACTQTQKEAAQIDREPQP